MSSWIKLDKSFSKFLSNRNKRAYHDVVPINIEDDSSQDSCDLNSTITTINTTTSTTTKKRKFEPLANVTITNQIESSEESSDVEYDPDGVQLPNAVKRRTKSTLPIVTSSALPHQSSSSHSTTSTTTLHPWTSKTIDEVNLTSNIEDPATDSDDLMSTPDTVIDESSTDSSLIKSQVSQQQESMIETQESITPPVKPYLVTTNKFPKKRKLRMVKGGMVERLSKSLSQTKSNRTFWHHHRSIELIASGTLVTVNRVENTYGRRLIHTKVNDEFTIFCLCSRSLDVRKGDVIEVKLDVDRSMKTDTHVLYAYVDKVLLINENS